MTDEQRKDENWKADFERELDVLRHDFQQLETIFHTQRESMEEKFAQIIEELRNVR